MADKPRVRAPKQRAHHRPEDSGRTRRLLLYAAGGVAALAVLVAAFFVLGLGGGEPSEADVRESFVEIGGTLEAVEALPGEHTLQEDELGEWNTDPPTSGEHFGFDRNSATGTVIWGAYEEPLQLARVVHNLEHGGIYIFYGDEVPEAVVEQLHEFYGDHERGTLLAPYPKLKDEIAVGAWVLDGEEETGYLAKSKQFDEKAFSSFFDAFQFEGPERFPADALLPGRN
jgi:Protein of unknown function (DUF3105)